MSLYIAFFCPPFWFRCYSDRLKAISVWQFRLGSFCKTLVPFAHGTPIDIGAALKDGCLPATDHSEVGRNEALSLSRPPAAWFVSIRSVLEKLATDCGNCTARIMTFGTSSVQDSVSWISFHWMYIHRKPLPIFCPDFHRCNKALSAKDQDVAPCEWYKRVYKSLCPLSWVRPTLWRRAPDIWIHSVKLFFSI